MPRYAVIDVGTNSVKFHIGEKGPDFAWRTIADRAEVTRLGERLTETGEISREAMERTVTAIAGMATEAQRDGVSAIAAVGTMGMRTARNSDAFIAEVEQRSGVRIEVISGEEEGRLAYLAVKAGLGVADGALVVFDTGGGSTQFTFGRGSVVDERFSLNVGAVRYTERFGLGRRRLHGAAPRGPRRDREGSGAARFSALPGCPGRDGRRRHQHRRGHARSGRYDADVVQGARVERAEVERQIELYRSGSVDDRRRVVGLQPQRAM
jgi:exopolyphosphatase/guanosine-5'-triphosphate,3'-diphosphate pyrophosphatase